MGGTAKRIGKGIATGGFSEWGPGGNLWKSEGGLGDIGGKGGKPPDVPDFTGAVERQSGISRENVAAQTQANRPNQNTPFANSQWTQGPDGQWTQNVRLSGGLGGASNAYQQQLASQAGQPVMTGDQARDQAITAAYGQATSRLDPQWSQRASALESAMANKGVPMGSAAYSSAQGDFDRARNDAYGSAMNSAIGQGTVAGDSAFRNNLAARQLPLQQLLGIQGMSSMPVFGSAGKADTPDYLGALSAAYGGQMQKYGIDQANKNSQLGGLASLGGAAIGASDEALKVNIERSLLEVLPGIPFASWEWKHAPGTRVRGVIAQDVEKVRPGLVVRGPTGHLFVKYADLWEAANG